MRALKFSTKPELLAAGLALAGGWILARPATGPAPVAAGPAQLGTPVAGEAFAFSSLPGGAFYGIDAYDAAPEPSATRVPMTPTPGPRPSNTPRSSPTPGPSPTATARTRPQVITAGARLMRSDNGRAWVPVDAPGALVHLLTSGNGGMLANDAAGQGYRTIAPGRAWSAVDLERGVPSRFLSISENFAQDGQALGITPHNWQLYRYDKDRSRWGEAVLRAGETHQVGAGGFSPNVVVDEFVLVGAEDGIYRSTDSGQTWQRSASAQDGAPVFGPNGGRVDEQGIVFPTEFGDDRDRRYDPDDPTIFAYNKDGIYRSDDKGTTWRKLGFSGGGVRDVAISNAWPYDPILLAAVAAPGHIGALSTDGGQTWSWIDGPPGISGTGAAMARDFGVPGADTHYNWDPSKGPTALSLPAVFKSAPIGFVERWRGSRELFLSTDGDGVWSGKLRLEPDGREVVEWAAAEKPASDRSLAAGEPSSALHLPDGSAILVGSRASGLYRSTDAGESWSWDGGPQTLPRGHGQAIHSLKAAPDFAASRTIFAATDSGVWVSRDGGRAWSRTDGPAPARALAISPNYAADRTVAASGHISRDGGQTWSIAGTLDARFAWSAVAFSPEVATDGTLWVALDIPEPDWVTLDQPLYVSHDRGQTWEMVNHGNLRRRAIYDLEAVKAGSDPLRVLAGTQRGLLVSPDGGKTWNSPPSFPSWPVRAVEARAISEPNITAVILAAGDGGLLWSINRGLTWEQTHRDLKLFRGADLAPDGQSFLAFRAVDLLAYDQLFQP